MNNALEQIYGYIQKEPWHTAEDVYQEFLERGGGTSLVTDHMDTLVKEIGKTKNLELGLIKTLEFVFFMHLYGSSFAKARKLKEVKNPVKKWYSWLIG
jgi:hypothetical protein